jgi:acyl-CoA dehydrogenase
VIASTAIPTAHLGWVSAWYAAACGALERYLELMRWNAAERRRFRSDLFCTRLAGVRLKLDLLESMLRRLIGEYEDLRASSAPPTAYEDAEWTVPLNGIKVAGSTLALEAVDSLVEMGGLKYGYLRDTEVGLERVLRDLRSASLMVSNDYLLQSNAKSMLLQRPEDL